MNTSTTTALLKCTFCALPAAPSDTTDPPACGAHGDLLVLTEWMRDQGEAITADSVAAHVRQARASSAGWTITPDEVEAMLPAIVEAREEAKIETAANIPV